MLLSQGFWQTSAAGSLITGSAATITATVVAVFTYRGALRGLDRQLDADRRAWRRDNLLKSATDYLATARAVADDAAALGSRQVEIKEQITSWVDSAEADRGELEPGELREVFMGDKDLVRLGEQLDVKWRDAGNC